MNKEYVSDIDSEDLKQLAVHINNVISNRKINAAIYDPHERKFFVTEFDDNENFSNFESFLLQINHEYGKSKFSLMINFPELPAEKSIL